MPTYFFDALNHALQRTAPGVDPQAAPLPEKATKKTSFAQANFEMRTQLYAICGVDLTRIPGFSILTVQALLSELGLDMSRWRSEKRFSSRLHLSPGNKISGGKRLTLVPVKGHNRAADILRLCAYAAIQSKSALGAYGRRMKSKHGAPKGIKALAQAGPSAIPHAQTRHGLRGSGRTLL